VNGREKLELEPMEEISEIVKEERKKNCNSSSIV
jgi:hypothetical protein